MSRRLPVPQQLGNSQEVVGQYGCAHQNLETLAAFGPAALHPPAAKQHRDAALDAHPKTLPLFERPAALQGCLFRGLLSAALGNAHLADSGLLAGVHIGGTVKAPIAGVQLGRMLEDLLMMVQRSLHLGGIGGIAGQNLIVGDQALGTLGQEDLVTEFHRLALLAPLDQVRVGLEDGVHLLVGRNLLSVEYPPTGLVNDLLAQVAVSRDLLAELVDRHAAEHVDTLDLGGLFDDLARAFQHMPGDAESFAVLGLSLRVPGMATYYILANETRGG